MKYKGLGVAMVTPMNSDGSIDLIGLKNLTNHLIGGGCDFLVVQGTTGESPTLSSDEKMMVLENVIEFNQNRIPIVYGVGGNNTREVVRQIEESNSLPIDGFLSVSPSYNKPSQRGIVEHFKAIADVSERDIILYNVPGRTGSNMSADTTLELADYSEKIVGIKEASGQMTQIMQLCKEKPNDFEIISGDDALTFPMVCLGATGVISVVGNAYPELFSQMMNLALSNQYAEARSIHNDLLNFADAIFQDGNPGGVKIALSEMEICEEYMRLPLVPVNSETRRYILETMELLK